MSQLHLLWNLQITEQKKEVMMQKKQSLNSKTIRTAWQDVELIQGLIAKQQADLAAHNKDIKILEESLAEINKVLIKIETQLYHGGIRNIKEIDQLRTKCDELKDNISVREDELLANMERSYQIEQKISDLKLQLSERYRQHEKEQLAIKQALAEIDVSLADIEKELTSITDSINVDLLSTYYKLKQSLKNPVARLNNEFCDGCHRSVPMVTIKAAKLGVICCDNCGRLLLSEN